METTLRTLQIQLSYSAHQSFVKDLQRKGLEFSSLTRTSLIIKNSSEVRESINLVKERHGAHCIYITNAEC